MYYLEVLGSFSASRLIKAELKTHQFECECKHLQHDEEPLPASVMNSFVDDHGVKFATWLIQAAARVGEGGKKQLWYHTFVSSYFGLSRTGIKTNAAGGLGVTLSYFDERLALMRSQLDDKLK
jgi:hypothetical protein